LTPKAEIEKCWRGGVVLPEAARLIFWARVPRDLNPMCPRSESPGTYIPAVTGELVLGESR
jgi:hypothetical protein